MFKVIRDEQIIAINESGEFPCVDYDRIEEDTEHTLNDYVQYNYGVYYLKEDLPAPTYEEQREKRQQAFTEEADPLKYNYEEDVARYGEDSEQAQESKSLWLAKKDEIRERYPYPVGE